MGTHNGAAGASPLLMGVSAKYAPVFYALVLLGCWLTWRPRWQRLAAIAGGAALVALGVGQLVGFALPRARPYLVTAATVLVPHGADTSFPSDDAILVAAVTIVLASLNRTLGAWLAALALVVLFWRVYIGVHYPTDVIGGAALAEGNACPRDARRSRGAVAGCLHRPAWRAAGDDERADHHRWKGCARRRDAAPCPAVAPLAESESS